MTVDFICHGTVVQSPRDDCIGRPCVPEEGQETIHTLKCHICVSSPSFSSK